MLGDYFIHLTFITMTIQLYLELGYTLDQALDLMNQSVLTQLNN